MNRSVLIATVLAVVGARAPAAWATNYVFFKMNGAPSCTGGATASGQPGGPGTELRLTFFGVGSCSWPVRLMLDYEGDGGDDGIYGWALDLYTPSIASKVSAAFVTYQSTGEFPDSNAFPPDNGPYNPSGSHYILSGNGRLNYDPNPFGVYPLMDITITKNVTSAISNFDRIYARVGTGAWGVNDLNFEQFAGQYEMGPNPPTPENGAAGTEYSLPVITIDSNTPEPATLALFGVLLMARRKVRLNR